MGKHSAFLGQNHSTHMPSYFMRYKKSKGLSAFVRTVLTSHNINGNIQMDENSMC